MSDMTTPPDAALLEMSAGDFVRWAGIDAQRWARAFAVIAKFRDQDPLDPTPGGYLHGWLSCAIEAGRTAGMASYREPIVCTTYPNCPREHVGGVGGTPMHLPPDGVVVPGHLDHGVPSDAALRNAT